jgi:hypothetical protein
LDDVLRAAQPERLAGAFESRAAPLIGVCPALPRTVTRCNAGVCPALPRTVTRCNAGGGSRASDFRECQHTTVNFSAVRRLIRVILDGRAFSVTSQLRSFPRAPRHRPATASTKSRCHDLTGGNCFPTAEKHFPPQTELYRCAPKTQLFYARPMPFCPQSAIVFSETATTGGRHAKQA